MNKIADSIEKFFAKVIPDAFPLSFTLLIIVMIMSLGLTDTSLPDVLGITGYGFVSLWAFTMQIVVVMGMGCVLANSPPVERVLKKMARSLGEDPVKVIFMVALLCNIIQYINSSFGMIAAAVFAREVIFTNKRVKPGLVVAAGYAGMCVHSIGLSPAIFSTIATPGHQFAEIMGVVPMTATTYWMPNLLLSLILGVGMPLVFALMQPRDYVNPYYCPEKADDPANTVEDTGEAEAGGVLKYENSAFVKFMENGKGFSVGLGILMLVAVVFWFTHAKGSLNFNTIAIMFFGLGLICWGSLRKFAQSSREAVRTLYAIIISFPIYAAIMKLMTDTGLANIISTWMTTFANADTLPLITFWAAGFINIFVPSAGGQWVVQAPSVLPAAVELGTGFHKIASAVALGDTWTNMIQPFWAIPILSITGVKVQEMIAYTFVICVFVGLVCSLWLGLVYPHF